jgi:carbonic anhydrase
MESYKRLLLGNKAWVAEKKALDSDFFSHFQEGQNPEFLWIGCSDSRVPTGEITATSPGQIFVHRNIANIVVHSDLNLLSVLEYAVTILKVKHVILCGHYGCGGIASALENTNFGILNKWLRHIKDVYRLHEDEISSLPDFKSKHDKLVELNVKEQIHNLASSTIIQKAWYKFNSPCLHGWIYDIKTGLINQAHLLEPGSMIHPIYRYNFEE